MISYSYSHYGKVRSTDEENGRWQENPLYVVSVSKTAVLSTIPIAQILVGNGKHKMKSLNREVWKRGCIPTKFQTILHIVQEKNPLERPCSCEDFSLKIRKLTAKWTGCINYKVKYDWPNVAKFNEILLSVQQKNYFHSTNYLYIQRNNYFNSTNCWYIQRNNYFDSTNY